MQPKFCNKCGNPLIEGDKFCRSCGAPIVVRNAAPVQSNVQMGNPKIPSYEDIAAKLNNAGANQYGQPQQYAAEEGHEGTVTLVDMLPQQGPQNAVVSAEIKLPLGDVLRGCTKVIDFGTGDKFEVVIPAGLSPGDVILVQDTGIRNPETGEVCDFELTITMG